MFNRLHIYTVHTKVDAKSDLPMIELVPEGFCLMAFVFTIFWALYHRMWWVVGALAGVNAALAGVAAMGWISSPTVSVLQLAIQLWMGVRGYDYLRARLKQDGFVMTALSSGENKARAEQRFVDRYAAQLG